MPTDSSYGSRDFLGTAANRMKKVRKLLAFVRAARECSSDFCAVRPLGRRRFSSDRFKSRARRGPIGAQNETSTSTSRRES